MQNAELAPLAPPTVPVSGNAIEDAAIPRPWYREPWPWFLMAGPIAVILAGSYSAYLAVSTNDGLVADDYYKRGLGINRVLERGERATALGLVAVVDVGSTGSVRVDLASIVPQLASTPARVRMTLVHPTHAGSDRLVELVRGPDGVYVGTLESYARGRRWLILETDDWRMPPHLVEGEIRAVRMTSAPLVTPYAGAP